MEVMMLKNDIKLNWFREASQSIFKVVNKDIFLLITGFSEIS